MSEFDEAVERREKYLAMLARCEHCPFAKFNGPGSWYCPLPYCKDEIEEAST